MVLHVGRHTMQLTSLVGQQPVRCSNTSPQPYAARSPAPIAVSAPRAAVGSTRPAQIRRSELICRAAAEAPAAEAKSGLEEHDIARTVLLQASRGNVYGINSILQREHCSFTICFGCFGEHA